MKVSELTGAHLDYWVAKIEGLKEPTIDEAGYGCSYIHHHEEGDDGWWTDYNPSSEWQFAGPIIEREGISLQLFWQVNGRGLIDWRACMTPKGVGEVRRWSLGAETPLIAAMRAYVTSKYGDYVPEPA